MSTSTSWPVNEYGTSWRRARMFFFWPDEAVVEEAIETLNPLKITVYWQPVAVGSACGDGRVSLRQVARMLEEDGDEDCAIIHPCEFPQLFAHQFGMVEDGDGWFHVVGIAHLDLADESTYLTLQKALRTRTQRFSFEVPSIRF